MPETTTAPEMSLDDQGNVLANGKQVMGATVLQAVLARLAEARRVILVPDSGHPAQRVIAAAADLSAAAQADDKVAAAGALGDVIEAMTEFVGMENRQPVDTRGVPQIDGIVPAGEATCQTLTGFGAETFNAPVDPKKLGGTVGEIKLFQTVDMALEAGREKVARNLIPRVRDAYDQIGQVAKVVAPVLETHAPMKRVFQPATTYLSQRYERAQRTRRSRRKDQPAKGTATVPVTPQAPLPLATGPDPHR